MLLQGVVSSNVSSGMDGSGDVDAEPPIILLFHSYEPTYEWTNGITAGVIESLTNSAFHNSQISFEYMDSKAHSSPEYIASLAQVYRYKYPDIRRFDLIICSDNNAIDFLCSEDGLEIFPTDIPVVFCGANDYDPTWFERRSNMTGVVEYIEPADTLDFILKVHPEANNLLVVRDHNTHTSHIVTEQTREAFAPYEDQLHITYLDDMSTSEMQATVENVSNDTVIFLLLFNRDSAGNEVPTLELIKLINASAKVPVYSAWDFYLGQGIVGGKLTSAYNEGKLAGEIAIDVLGGTDPDDIPLRYSEYHEFMFDWAVMEKYSLSEDDLPENSIMINRDLGFYGQYKKEIHITSLVILVLIMMVFLLLINRQALKRTQVELIRSKENAEKADRLKSSFLANVGHEFRTPITVIIGFTQMLQKADISDEEKEHYGDIVSKNCDQLLRLINNVLDISTIEAGEININKKTFNVNSLLDEIYSIFHTQIEAKKLSVELELVKGLDDMDSVIFSDDDRIRQVLMNLLGNAIKFTNEGSIAFGYSMLENNTLEFFIKDTGIGISDDESARIFGRFQQVDDSYSRKYEGIGLELAISKGIVQLLGGDLWFESEYGAGSIFYFTLPYIQDPV